jgi:hypothetical protein
MADNKDETPLDDAGDAGDDKPEPKRGGLSFPSSASKKAKPAAAGGKGRPRTQQMGSIGDLVTATAKAEEEAAKAKAKAKAEDDGAASEDAKPESKPFTKPLLSSIKAKGGAKPKPFTKPLVGATKAKAAKEADSEADTVAVAPKSPLPKPRSDTKGNKPTKPLTKPPVPKAKASKDDELVSEDEDKPESKAPAEDSVAALPVVDVGTPAADDDADESDDSPIDALPIVGVGTSDDDGDEKATSDKPSSPPPSDKEDDDYVEDGPSLGALMAEELDGHEIKAEVPIKAEPDDVPPLAEASDEADDVKLPMETGGSKKMLLIGAVVVVVLIVAAVFVLGGGDGETKPAETAKPATTAAPTSTATAEPTAEPTASAEADDAGAEADAAPSATASATAPPRPVVRPKWRPPREDIYE